MIGRILFIVFAVLICVRIVRRQFDFFSVAGICLIIYNIYCAVGKVWISSRIVGGGRLFYSSISGKLYAVILTQMALMYAAMILADRLRPAEKELKTIKKIEFSEKELFWAFLCAGVISVSIMAVNVFSIGLSELSGNKSQVWAQTNMLYVTGLWIAMAVFAYSIKKKKYLLLLLSVPQIAVHLYIGSRAYTAVIGIVLLLYIAANMKNDIRSRLKVLVIGAVFLFLIMIYKKVWTNIKAGNLAGIIKTLKDPDTYAWVFRWGEPRIVLADFEYILQKKISLSGKEIIARFITIVPLARDRLFGSSVNYLMSDIIMKGLNSSYGLASNFWGECYAIGSYWFIFIAYVIWLGILELGNRIIRNETWTACFLMPMIAYMAFYIHRMDMGKLLGNIKMCICAACIWLAVVFIIKLGASVINRIKAESKDS